MKVSGKADLRRYQAAMAMFENAPRKTVTPAALNHALREICHPSKTGWMLKRIGFKLRANKEGRRVVSYTLIKAPALKRTASVTLAPAPKEVSLSQFRANWPSLMEDVSRQKVARITVFKRGKPFVTLTGPPAKEAKTSIFGGLKGSAVIPRELDLTKPVFEGEIDAENGVLHR